MKKKTNLNKKKEKKEKVYYIRIKKQQWTFKAYSDARRKAQELLDKGFWFMKLEEKYE